MRISAYSQTFFLRIYALFPVPRRRFSLPFSRRFAIMMHMDNEKDNFRKESAETHCMLCPVKCGANRSVRAGYCGVRGMNIAKYYLHPYEEPCISFAKGSGTIFFTGCNLKCVFCQNYEVSRAERGMPITPARLADIFRELEDAGADNVSLVTPSHLIGDIEKAFKIYRPKIPVVYNSGGYDDTESLKRIDDYIDIYLPDLKYVSPFLSERYTGRADYFSVASKAIKFMARKPLLFDEPAEEKNGDKPRGKMLSGLIVRHLVMPLGVNDSFAAIKWFKEELPPSAYLSLMSQYTPFGKIEKYPELSRPVTAREYDAVVNEAFALGIENLFIQKRSSSGEKYIPSWDY